MGEASYKLNQALMFLQNTDSSLRLCHQTFLAFYLLENGYTEPASFFAHFTKIPDPIVIPSQYRISLTGTKIITEIHCHA